MVEAIFQQNLKKKLIMTFEVLKNSEKNLLMLGLHNLDPDGAGYLLKREN